MSKIIIFIWLCLLLYWLLEYVDSTNIDDTKSEHHVAASIDGKEVILDNENGMETPERIKRLYSDKLLDSFNKLKTTFEKSLSDKLESPVLGAVQSSSILQGKSKLSSLLDTYKSSISTGLSKGISLAPLTSIHHGDETESSELENVGAAMPCITSEPSVSSVALSQSDETVGAAAKPIVLPDYLLDQNSMKKVKKPQSNRISLQQLQETANLRTAINNAVKHGIYVHSASEVKYKNSQQNSRLNQAPPSPNRRPTQQRPTQYNPFRSQYTTPRPPPQPQYNTPRPTHAPPSYYYPQQPPQYSPYPPPSSGNFPPNFSQYGDFFNSFWQNLVGDAGPQIGSARSDFSYVDKDSKSPKASPDEKLINPLPGDNESSMKEKINLGDNDDDVVEKMMAKAAQQLANEGIVSNTVESYANSVEVPSIETNQVREELNITSVKEDTSFKIGENVRAWRTLQRHKRESHALIGMTNTSIVLVQEKNGVYKLKVEVPMLSKPTFFEIFTFWNQTQRSIDGIVIVSIQNELVFLRVNEAMDKMEIIWMWPTNNLPKYLHHFVIDNSDTLLIITDLHNGSAASLYRFDMNEEVFFLRQTLSLKSRALNMALIQSGHETFICFPQTTHAVIYKHEDSHFKYYTKIESKNARILSGFQMGGYSYLTIGGRHAKILRYHRGKFIDQTILSKSWGDVEFFLPVPARTYRDDLILFIQHRIDYGSHTNAFMEALIWNGHAFHPALQVPCYINGRMSDSGIACMLDEYRELGIIGATMFQRNRTISILVPRQDAPSGLFDLEIELLPASYTMNDHLLELLSEVVIMLETRNNVLLKARDVINSFPKGAMDEVTIKNQTLDTIYTKNIDLSNIVPTEGIFLGNDPLTKETVDEFFHVLNETETSLKILAELKRNKREDNDASEQLHLKSFNVSDLNVQYINDIPIDDFVFVEDGNLSLDTVVLDQPIDAEIIERLQENFANAQLGLETTTDTTTIKGDLTFDEINGIQWKDFINQIILKHLPNTVDDIEIIGDVIAESALSANHLNELPFPNGYISTETTEEIVVTGRKVFKNSLITEAMDCFEDFNKVDLSRVVTLNGTQFIGGTTTFRKLEVTESLEMGPNATISGRRLDEFLSNPTLQETRQISATVHIDTLEIEGPIYVRNKINDIFLDEVLSDIVYKHEPNPQITSFKRFGTVQAADIRLTADLINGTPFSQFVTTDTMQTFNVSKLRGNVYFQRLNLDGLFNFINVTEVDMNSLKLFGEQYTDAELVFEDGEFLSIDATQLDVLETVNNIDVHDFIDIDGDFELTGNVNLNSLHVNELIVNGVIKGNRQSLINGFQLSDLIRSHFSKNHRQNFTKPVYIPKAVLRNGVNISQLNGYDFETIVKNLRNFETNEQMLNGSHVDINQMFVNGSILLSDVNGYDFEEVKANVIPLDQTNNIDLPITFLDPIFVNGKLNIIGLHGEKNFNDFVNNLVRKSAKMNRIYGTTIFNEDVTVSNNAKVTTINEIQVDHILTKNFNREILNSIRIIGDVTIPNLNVKGTLNGVSGERLSNYSFNQQTASFTLKNDVFFNQSIAIKHFYVQGGYNDIGNIHEHLKGIIRTDRPARIIGTKTFKNSVNFENGININKYNGIDVQRFLSNVVLIDQLEPVDIYSDVVFAAPVIAPRMNITGDITTTSINNITVADLVQNTIRIDKPFNFDGTATFPEGTFESSNIDTHRLNEHPVEEIFTLNTPQAFDKPVHLNYVYSTVPIKTSGLVSGYDLPKERANTLMVYGTQNISIPTIFQSVRVLSKLETAGLVNGRDIKLAASLKGNIIVDSPLSFGSVAVDRLYTNDLISGINFDKWYENSFLRFKQTPQVVTAPWLIKHAAVDILTVDQGMNGMDVNQFIGNLDQFHKQHHEIFKHKCQTAKELIQETQNNQFFLSHFSSAFTIDTQNAINSIYLFAFFDHNYMLINSGCETMVYAWNMENKTYNSVSTLNTGDVYQWIHVLDPENQLFLISNNDGSIESNCPFSGAFIWRFNPNDNQLKHAVQFGENGDYRSMQMKPNSHALFYVIRNSDSHVVEYNLRGAIVSEWNQNADGASEPSLTESVRFVPDEAQLGLALSDGKRLSMLNECNCTERTKRCLLVQITGMDLENYRAERQKKIEKTMAQLRMNLENCREFLRSLLISNKVNLQTGVTFSQLNQSKIDNLREILSESNEQMEPILSSSHTQCSEAAIVKTSMSSDETTSTKAKTVSIHQNEMPTTTEPTPMSHNQNITLQIDGKFIADLIDAMDEVIATNKSFATIAKLNVTDRDETDQINVSSTANLVDLFDLFYEVLKENRKKHKQENHVANESENVASQLNTAEEKQIMNDSLVLKEMLSASNATNQMDPKVGTLFGMFMLEKTLSHTIDRVSKLMLGNDNDEENADGQRSGLFGLLGSPHINLTNDILNTIEEVRTTSNCEDEEDVDDDSIVGDQFGDIMFKLEPFADQIIDKIVDEIRRRNQTARYAVVDSAHEEVIKKENADKILRKHASPMLSAVDVLTIMEVMDAIDTSMNQSKSDETMVGSAAKLVDLMDWAERILIENRENHRKNEDYSDHQGEHENSYILGTTMNRNELNQAMNDSLNVHNLFANISSEPSPKVGTLFGAFMIDKSLAYTISRAADTFFQQNQYDDDEEEDDEKEHILGLKQDIFDGLESPHHVNTDPVEHILNLISLAENLTMEFTSSETHSDPSLGDVIDPVSDNILNKVNYELQMRQYDQQMLGLNQEDPRVGDQFGEVLSKLTPFADNIIDQVVDEIRRRESSPVQKKPFPYNRDQNSYDDQFLLQSTHNEDAGDEDDDEDNRITSQMSGFFRKIGQSMVKVYSFGKDHLDIDSAADAANDLKQLAIEYIKDYVEDNVNNNKSYGAPEETVDDKTLEKDQPNVDSVQQTQSKSNLSSDSLRKVTTNENPKGREFVKSFVVEMLNSLVRKTTTDQTSDSASTFWPMIKNAVKALFEMNQNNTELDKNQDKSKEHHLVLKELMHKAGQVSKFVERKQSEMNSADEMVGSTLNAKSVDDKKFEDLFNKFTPLINLLSDRVVKKLLNARREQRKKDVEEPLSESLVDIESNRNEVHEEIRFKCSQNLTMEEFAQKLEEFKQQNPNMFSWMDTIRNAKDEDEDSPTLEAESTKQIEATVIKIPDHSLPTHQNNEIIAIRVGSTQQLLIAVTSITENTIKSDHDRIQIFEDFTNGKLFQTISCYKPRSLITFNINMDTILAFVQDEFEVKTYILRGTIGFVEFTSFKMPSPIKQMIHNEIMTHSSQSLCPEHFLVLVMENKIEFMTAVTIGDCKINENLNC
ncbi:uncharacterized protein LOC116342472 [Contarinia nasturtii]|uniref:uncharacterized protein LOC116342472 n=1 Tax=Contarinia nasturtii TaxID=265458 RepID=UPI0012D4B144|nr:uncharacterized protein LOC116342472 [Contarinia nasturtii]